MVKQYKVDAVSELKGKLQERGNFIFTKFSGVKVKDLSALRKQLRQKNSEYKVVKNTLFQRALNELGYTGLDNHLKGPIGVAFISNEVSEVAKVLKDFAKEKEKFSFSVGVIDKIVYDEKQIAKIADLPSKETLLAQIMGLINGPARSTATGMNQIMASLARGIKAVAEANENK
jgi:large subunit ribosomal protein L10